MIRLSFIIKYFALVLLGLLTACGGSGGGGNNSGTAPSITDLSISPPSVYVNYEGGQTDIVGTFSFSAPDGNLDFVTLTVLDNEGLLISSEEIAITGLSGLTSGALQGMVTISTATAGSFTVQIFVTDTSGLSSNTIESLFHINERNSEAPYLYLGGNISASERETIQLSAVTDALEDVTYSWTQISGPTVSVQGTSSLNAEITLPSVSENTSLMFRFEITLANGSIHSDEVEVFVLAYTNIREINFTDQSLSDCISDSISGTSIVDVEELTSLSCENVSDAGGIEELSFLTNLNLSNNFLTSLAPLSGLELIKQLNLSGNEFLVCEQIEELESNLTNIIEFVKDDLCIGNKGVDLGAIGFDAVVDEGRRQIYVSIPTRNEIAVISTERMRVIDRILLGGEPYGIDLSIDGDSLYVAVRGTDSVAEIDLESRIVNTIPIANQTGHASLYDVIEAAPNRVFVSSAPGSGGSAYIAQIDLEQSNLVTQAANGRMIRANPTFARSPDYSSLYVSEGFSPNSLYKLNLMDPEAPIVLEDDHGAVSGTYNMSINLSGTRIALASGQVLRTGSFIEEGNVSSGLSVPSRKDNHLYVLKDNSDMEIFDFATLERIGSVNTTCDYGTTSKFGIFNDDESIMFLQQDVICIKGQFSQSSLADAYPMLVFEDLGLEECVIATAEALGYTLPSEIDVLDCSTSQKNIISLNSINKLENLHTLNLSGHSVFSITPLSDLTKLETLIQQNSVISSLEPLTNIETLKEINVVGSERIPCDELSFFQLNGVSIAADFCTQSSRIELGGLGTDMEYNTSTNKLYVSIPSLESITEIDIDNKAISNNYPVGGQAQRIDLSSDGKTVYTTLYGDGDIAYLQLSTGNVETVDISIELDDDRVWDIAEVSPDRIVVSSNPGSNGFAYIVEVRRDLGNVATRVASQQIIRASPVFAVADNSSSVYVGAGFSPNSLYKLDATMPEMPIIVEDNHGDVSGTSHLTLNSDNTLIYLASGQVLSTTTFNQIAKFNSGDSWLSQDGQSLYIADGESDAVGIYDTSTTAKVGRQEFGCDVLNIQALQELPDIGISVLGDDLVCFTRVIPFN